MGPWSHGQWAFGQANNLGNIYWGLDANKKFQAQEKSFFDYYLEGKGKPDIAEATIFVTGSNEWKNFETWPPKNVVEKTLFFQPAGGLSFAPPETKTASMNMFPIL